MVLKIKHSIEMVLKPCRFSVENFSALGGLEVKLGRTWSEHDPDMVRDSRTGSIVPLPRVKIWCYLALPRATLRYLAETSR